MSGEAGRQLRQVQGIAQGFGRRIDELEAALKAAERGNERLREAATPLARLPIPVASDERTDWLICQQRLRDVLAQDERLVYDRDVGYVDPELRWKLDPAPAPGADPEGEA